MALALNRHQPEEAVMEACYVYDLRAAKSSGMKMIYVRRWADDTQEDTDVVRTEVQGFFRKDGFKRLLDAVRSPIDT